MRPQPTHALRLEQRVEQEQPEVRFRIRKGSVERVTYWLPAKCEDATVRTLTDRAWVVLETERRP